MEQQQRSLIFTAAVGLIILSIIIGSIYYLVKFIQGRVATSGQSAQITENVNPESTQEGQLLPQTQNDQFVVPQTGSSPTSGEQTAPVGRKVYNTAAFRFSYPDSWGVLSCSNSQNIELDPSNPQDLKLNCDIASKPVTVIVGETAGCQGDAVKIGNFDVVKTKVNEGSYIKYQWCTKTEPVLNITHRVSPDGERATSKEDYSGQIEEIISNLSFSSGS